MIWHRSGRLFGAFILLVLLSFSAGSTELPEGYMSLEESQAILDKSLTIVLAPDLSVLSPAEKGAAQRLLEVGKIFQKLYESSLHHQARFAYETLLSMDEVLGSPKGTQNLLELFYLFKGPIAKTLDNRYMPILPVDERVPGKNVYPWGISKRDIEEFLASHPETRPELLSVRTVVRRSEKDAVQADLAALDRYPALDLLHPGLKRRLEELAAENEESSLYAVPYSVAYANDLVRAYHLLRDAAGIVRKDDEDLADYLEQRAVDLLTDEYEAGDAAWVRGSFENLNAQIGSYEVYDDELYAVKSFFGLSLMLRDREASEKLGEAVAGIQALEESLPYEHHRSVQEDIPIGVYDVIADFGQARGTNTATILPNESRIARKYGRTILIRRNILENDRLFEETRRSWDAAVDSRHSDDYEPRGNFHRTLWHEIGHYLGPDHDRRGRALGDAFEEDSQILEELKADLVALYLVDGLRSKGYYDDRGAKSVYASGIRRVLLKNKPRREQTYQTMELMQMNYYLQKGLLAFDSSRAELNIDYARYHDVVASMLREILSLQYQGDKAAADRFIESYSTWNPNLHGVLAERMRSKERYRYVIVRYAVLEE